MKKLDMPFVIVEWDDAWQDQDNFATAHGITSTHGPMPVRTRGLLIQDDALGISVANEDSVQDGMPVFRGRTFIPRAMIRSVTEYRLARKKKKASEEAYRAAERGEQWR